MKIPIVDENDEIIKVVNKDEADLHPELIYRVSALWITNSKGEILLARRAFNKVHSPGKWGSSVAGTVEEGETYEENMIKEMEEELGIKNAKPVSNSKYRHTGDRNYFVQRFNLVLDRNLSEFKIQKDEVVEIKWFTRDELLKELKEHPDDFLKDIHENMKE
jgi:isopentenyl-diphosphate delta-isomerase